MTGRSKLTDQRRSRVLEASGCNGFPDLVKIDVDGFECSVLRGASQVMRRHPKVAIEVHPCWLPRYGSSASEVVALLSLDSYRVWILPHGLQQVKPWSGEELGGYSQKFNLFLLPAQL